MLKGERTICQVKISLLLLAPHVTRLTFPVLCYLKTPESKSRTYGVMAFQNNNKLTIQQHESSKP